jgi:hypothetical protein
VILENLLSLMLVGAIIFGLLWLVTEIAVTFGDLLTSRSREPSRSRASVRSNATR